MSTSKDFRKSTFKNRGLNADELRRRREEATVEIRKQKREDALFKRRNVSQVTNEDESESSDSLEFSELASEKQHVPLITRLAKHSKGIYSTDLYEVYANAKAFREILAKGKSPPIDEVIKCGVIPRFVDLIQSPLLLHPPQSLSAEQMEMCNLILFEACWSLTNITFGTSEQTMQVVNHGAVPALISLLQSSSSDVRDQAIWTLGNIIGDGPHCRDMLLGMNFMEILCEFIRNELVSNKSLSIARNSVWCLSNLCRGKPIPNWEKVKFCLPLLSELLHSQDAQILSDACWAIAYISDGSSDHISALIHYSFIPRLVELLSHSSLDVQSPSLRTIGNIVTGNDAQTQAVLDCNVIQPLKDLLHSTRNSIQREACWAISNIAAGTCNQVQYLIDSSVFCYLIPLLAHSEYRTKKEACWAVSNATGHRRTNPDQVRYLVSQGVIKALCDFLNYDDPKMLIVALDALSNILEVGESDALREDIQNQYAILVEEVDGLKTLSDLQHHRMEEIYLKSRNIIDKFFSGEQDEFDIQANENEFYFAPTNESTDFSKNSGGYSFD